MYSTKRPTGSMHVYQVPIYILYIYLPKFQCTMWAKKGTTHENDKDKHQKKERPGETHETAKGTKGHPLVLWWANMSTPNGTNSPIEQHDSVSHPSVRTSCTSSVDVATQTWARWFGVKSLCLRSTQAWLWGLIHTKVDAKTTCLPCFCMTNQIFWILEWFTHQSSKIPSPSQVSRTKSINQTHHQNQTLVAKTSDQRYRGTSQWSQGHGG